jgi:hypothetical protein
MRYLALLVVAALGCTGDELRPSNSAGASPSLPAPVYPEIAQILSSYDAIADFCGIGHVAPLTDAERADCEAKIVRAFFARAAERYAWADWNAIANHCEGYPSDCQGLEATERVVLASHLKREAQTNQAGYAQQQAARERATLDAINQSAHKMGQQMQR